MIKTLISVENTYYVDKDIHLCTVAVIDSSWCQVFGTVLHFKSTYALCTYCPLIVESTSTVWESFMLQPLSNLSSVTSRIRAE
jgi:hypothetical protein